MDPALAKDSRPLLRAFQVYFINKLVSRLIWWIGEAHQGGRVVEVLGRGCGSAGLSGVGLGGAGLDGGVAAALRGAAGRQGGVGRLLVSAGRVDGVLVGALGSSVLGSRLGVVGASLGGSLDGGHGEQGQEGNQDGGTHLAGLVVVLLCLEENWEVLYS